MRLARWPDDRPVWTASCPCQPYSTAGKGLGDEDPRNLWPYLFRLIRQCRPTTIFGEQVAAAIGHGWLDGIFADLEGENYSCGAAVLGAHSVGAPHIRQRVYWLAYAAGERLVRGSEDPPGIATSVSGPRTEPDCGWREFHGRRISAESVAFPLAARIPAGLGLGEPALQRLVRGARSNWRNRLKAYGNAVVPQVAAEFVRAFVEATEANSPVAHGSAEAYKRGFDNERNDDEEE
jgi:DNA (cytosine-5)-methyltransferase 1